MILKEKVITPENNNKLKKKSEVNASGKSKSSALENVSTNKSNKKFEGHDAKKDTDTTNPLDKASAAREKVNTPVSSKMAPGKALSMPDHSSSKSSGSGISNEESPKSSMKRENFIKSTKLVNENLEVELDGERRAQSKDKAEKKVKTIRVGRRTTTSAMRDQVKRNEEPNVEKGNRNVQKVTPTKSSVVCRRTIQGRNDDNEVAQPDQEVGTSKASEIVKEKERKGAGACEKKPKIIRIGRKRASTYVVKKKEENEQPNTNPLGENKSQTIPEASVSPVKIAAQEKMKTSNTASNVNTTKESKRNASTGKRNKSTTENNVTTPTSARKVNTSSAGKRNTSTSASKVTTSTSASNAKTPTSASKVNTPTSVSKVKTPTSASKVNTPTSVSKASTSIASSVRGKKAVVGSINCTSKIMKVSKEPHTEDKTTPGGANVKTSDKFRRKRAGDRPPDGDVSPCKTRNVERFPDAKETGGVTSGRPVRGVRLKKPDSQDGVLSLSESVKPIREKPNGLTEASPIAVTQRISKTRVTRDCDHSLKSGSGRATPRPPVGPTGSKWGSQDEAKSLDLSQKNKESEISEEKSKVKKTTLKRNGENAAAKVNVDGGKDNKRIQKLDVKLSEAISDKSVKEKDSVGDAEKTKTGAGRKRKGPVTEDETLAVKNADDQSISDPAVIAAAAPTEPSRPKRTSRLTKVVNYCEESPVKTRVAKAKPQGARAKKTADPHSDRVGEKESVKTEPQTRPSARKSELPATNSKSKKPGPKSSNVLPIAQNVEESEGVSKKAVARLKEFEDEVYTTPSTRIPDEMYTTPKLQGAFVEVKDEEYSTPRTKPASRTSRRKK